MIVMPSNWFSPAPGPLPYLLMQELPKAVAQITRDLLSCVCKKSKPFWFDRIFSMMGKLEISGGHYWGKRIKVLEYALYHIKEITFEDGSVWNNSEYGNWLETYKGKSVEVLALGSFYPNKCKITQ